MRELVVQAANDTNTSEDRKQIQKEITELQNEIDRIASTTQFNTKPLLNGTLAASGLVFQIGANSSQTIELTIKDMHADALGATGVKVDDIDVEAAITAASISAYLSVLDKAIDQVSTERAKLGAYQNRLEHTVANLDTSAENLQAAESRIRDVDMAKEMMEFTRTNILAQAGTAMLAQANAKPQTVLQLLQ
jgi:flagellin